MHPPRGRLPNPAEVKARSGESADAALPLTGAPTGADRAGVLPRVAFRGKLGIECVPNGLRYRAAVAHCVL